MAAATYVLASPAVAVSVLDRLAKARVHLVHELAAHVVVRNACADRIAADQHAFHQGVRVEPQQITVLAGARFGLV